LGFFVAVMQMMGQLHLFLKLRGDVRQEGPAGAAHSLSRPRRPSQKKTARNTHATKFGLNSLLPIPSWRQSTKSTTLYSESVSITKRAATSKFQLKAFIMVDGDPQVISVGRRR
jgi:hypothetical protein